ncbi:MAG: Signal recognition particle receptor FtsY [Chlamydiae bacterium]|nr:Signal recognition particle receptor FtsY [Chlamydiota bacterium]
MVLKFFKSSYSKVKNALSKTRSVLGNKIRSLFQGKIDTETLDKLEQLFYEADLGIEASMKLTEKVQEIFRENPSLGADGLIEEIRKEIVHLLSGKPIELNEPPQGEGPMVILIVGVNGNGKTTGVAKLAKRYQESGKKVLIAAADTFRAAAVEQLEVWTNRIGVQIVKGAPNSDSAAVAFDALTAAKARGVDVIIIDTAGRLHTRNDLMKELEKIKRACQKVIPNSPHETLLVLDATIGQNAIDQAKIFHQYTPISGLFLTKLDGTAKGGIIINIQTELGIPVKFIGIGETLDDIEPFNAENFAAALFD